MAFAVSTGASIYILLPKKKFVFALVGSTLYEQFFGLQNEFDEIYRRLAYDLDRFWEANDVELARLFRSFEFAAGGLAVEVVLLLASVSGSIF